MDDSQLKYAAADAYVAVEIYDSVKHLPNVGVTLEGQPVEGSYASIHPGCQELPELTVMSVQRAAPTTT